MLASSLGFKEVILVIEEPDCLKQLLKSFMYI